MAGSTLTTVAHIYKRKYSEKAVEEIASREHPTFNLIKKEGGFSGELFAYGIDASFPQGVHGTYAQALLSVSGTKGFQLVAFRKPKFGIITLNGEAMAACTSDGALYDLVTKESDRILKEVGDALAFDLFRNGTGIRGRRSAAAANVITLTAASDVRNFKINMTVGASALATGLTPRVGTTTVTAIDEDLGTITLASAAAIAAFANSDYLFRAADPGTCMEGFSTCTPLTAPTAGDSFRGIDRSVDVNGLSGVRVATSSGSIIADFGNLAVKANMRGKKLPRGVLAPTNFWTVSQVLNAKVEYDNGGGTAEVGFEYITINTPGGAMRIYSDPDCPVTEGRAFNPEAHYLKSLKGLPHVRMDGNGGVEMARLSTEDATQLDVRAWVNYFQTDTAAHGVIQI
jgi:hypothetical protein